MKESAEGAERTRQRTKKDSRSLFGEFMLAILAASALYVILSGKYGHT